MYNQFKLILIIQITLFPFFFSHCARQSPRYDQGREILREALFFQLTGEDLQSSGQSNEDNSPLVVSTIPETEGQFVTVLRSVDFRRWTDFDFASRSLGSEAGTWDIGFQRYKVRTNGGGTNPGAQGAACKSNTKSFPSQSTTSLSIGCGLGDFEEDRVAQAEVAGGGGTIFIGSDVFTNFESGWFTYQLPSLNPTMDVFVVRSRDGGRYYAVQIIGYYSEAGTSGYPSFRWRQIPLD